MAYRRGGDLDGSTILRRLSPVLWGWSWRGSVARNDAFTEAARDLAEMIQQRVTNLEREGQEIEARLRQINQQRKVARGLTERLLNFRPMRGTNYQCPRCWVE